MPRADSYTPLLGADVADGDTIIIWDLSAVELKRITIAELRRAIGIIPVAKSAVKVSHTGDTSEFVLATIPIAAGVLGVNSRLRITVMYSNNSTADNKTLALRFGASGAGLAGSLMAVQTVTTTLSGHGQVDLCNRGALNSQVCSSALGSQLSGLDVYTSSINTALASEIAITGQLSNAGDSIVLEGYSVEIIL